MNRHKEAFPAMLALSTPLAATLTAFSAHAAMSPGHVYDTRDVVVRDGSRQCVRTFLWSKENATKECNPELFPEPKVVAAPPPPPPPAPKPAPVVAAVPVVVAAKPAPKPVVMVFPGAALFATNKADLTPAGQKRIQDYREEARALLNSATSVKITGHTDSSGTAEYNQQLSLRRAETVRDYLVKLGANSSLMQVSGMGMSKPIGDNKTAAGRAENRRVEVEVTGTLK